MLSIIICSNKPLLLEKVSQNISETVGVPFEIIPINNITNQFGICEAYNNGAEISTFDNLCFVHEDVLFHTQNWGKIITDTLSDESVGLLGVAGSTYKHKTPSPWWLHYGEANNHRVNLIQHRKGGKEIVRELMNPQNETIADVVVIDGVFMCCRKSVWQQHRFDSLNFPKFHFYDIDFSMQILQTHRVKVVYNIDIEHFSRGSYNSQWIDAAIEFSQKWKAKLPAFIFAEDLKKIKSQEKSAKYYMSKLIVENNHKKKYLLRFFLPCLFPFPFTRENLILMKNLLRILFPRIYRRVMNK